MATHPVLNAVDPATGKTIGRVEAVHRGSIEVGSYEQA